jgi:mRNA interferase MazF
VTLDLPTRGEIWLVDLEPTRGREQQGRRPALVVSTDRFNRGPAELLIVLPVTKVSKDIPSHVPLPRSRSGLDHDSFIICEQVRCISRERLARRIGAAPPETMERVSFLLRVLMDL